MYIHIHTHRRVRARMHSLTSDDVPGTRARKVEVHIMFVSSDACRSPCAMKTKHVHVLAQILYCIAYDNISQINIPKLR